MKVYKKSLYIFRRDLRIEDNTALRKALEISEKVLPCFIINPDQVGSSNNFRSMHAIQFMAESLKELANSLKSHSGKLYLFHEKPEQLINRLIKSEQLSAIFVNKDYTPYSRARDTTLEELCEKYGIDFIQTPDALLIEPEDGLTNQQTPYKVFTPFYNKNKLQGISEPKYHQLDNYATHKVSDEKDISLVDTLYPTIASLHTKGGRSTSLEILSHLDKFENYKNLRNNLSDNTTGLSAHNKFGTVSIREVAHAIIKKVGPDNGLLRQLYWRDFFYHIACFYPKVFGEPFQEKYTSLSWNTCEKDFSRWCEGTTGFPVVDAGMRQLNATGYMHNRARLIVGSFLTKDLHINWLWGEKYFAQTLQDYDPCVNNGSWQWVASTGCDAQPYFRIFNPWLQQKRYDLNCEYIKSWIPELRNIDNNIIHSWFKQTKSINGYPPPMIDHKKESSKTKELYKKAAL